MLCQQKQKGDKEPDRPKFDAEARGWDADLVAMLERDMISSDPNVHW